MAKLQSESDFLFNRNKKGTKIITVSTEFKTFHYDIYSNLHVKIQSHHSNLKTNAELNPWSFKVETKFKRGRHGLILGFRGRVELRQILNEALFL